MTETMHDCYLSQFRCVQQILRDRKNILSEFEAFFQSVAPDRIYLLGSGTSLNACNVAAPYMEKTLRMEVTSIVPSALGNFYGKRPLVIAVSQSGRSTNTIAAIEAIRGRGIPVVTLTDPKETPVGAAGDLAVHLAAQNELIGPRTRGYAATVLTLYLMAMEAGLARGTMAQADYDGDIAALARTFDDGDLYYQACQRFYDLHFDNLRNARSYVFTGKGSDAKVADECALKVLETVCYPAFGYEYEEFLHGPVCFADEQLAVFLFLSEDEDRERMLKSADILATITPNCYIVSHSADVKGDHVLVLPSATPGLSSAFTNVLFGQLISAKLTVDLARTRHPRVKDIFANMGTKAAVPM